MEKTAISKQAVPSGVFRMDNTRLYVCGNETIILGFEKTILLNHLFSNAQNYTLYHHPTILSFRLPKSVAWQLSLIAARCDNGTWISLKNEMEDAA